MIFERKTSETDRINAILYNSTYRAYIKSIEACEKDRIFCRHDIHHFLDVARIAYILSLEHNYGYTKDIIYATALLHDIGRFKQYTENIPHHMASAELARPILVECGFNQDEIEEIIGSILAHREDCTEKESLNHIIFMADKASRACFSCKATAECNWSEEKKNHGIKY